MLGSIHTDLLVTVTLLFLSVTHCRAENDFTLVPLTDWRTNGEYVTRCFYNRQNKLMCDWTRSQQRTVNGTVSISESGPLGLEGQACLEFWYQNPVSSNGSKLRAILKSSAGLEEIWASPAPPGNVWRQVFVPLNIINSKTQVVLEAVSMEGQITFNQIGVRRGPCGPQCESNTEIWPDESTRCLCSAGQLSCSPSQCPTGQICGPQTGGSGGISASGTCTIHSHTDCSTFDGVLFRFMAPCTYILAQSCSPTESLPMFSVEVVNEQNRNSSLPTVRQVTVETANFRVSLLKQKTKRVVVNGVWRKLPLSLSDGTVNIRSNPAAVILETTFGLSVSFDSAGAIHVVLPSTYSNKVCGLCGNFNQLSGDDFRKPDGTNAEDATALAESWQTAQPASSCETILVPHQCDPLEEAEYASELHCGGLLSGTGPFADCHLVLGAESYFRGCVVSMCSAHGDPAVLCEALQVYVDICKEAGVAVPIWRNSTFCPAALQCGENSYYNSCADGCPEVCSSLDLASSCGSCEERCECKSGYKLSGGKCVPAEDCGCWHNGKHYEKGTTFVEGKCVERCQCMGNNDLWCTDIQCAVNEICKDKDGVKDCFPLKPATCRVYGDPHYITFDSTAYNFQGGCSYTLATTCGEETPIQFAVTGHNMHPPAQNFTRAKLEAVTLQVEDLLLTVNQSGQVYVNNSFVWLPYSTTGPYGSVWVYVESHYIILKASFGLTITVDGQSRLFLGLDEHYKYEMCGMCGTYSGHQDDDFVTPDGHNATDVFEFGDSWRVFDNNECTAYPNEPALCDYDKEDEAYSYCNTLLGDSFKPCHELVHPTIYIRSCVYDYCATNGDQYSLCESLTSYAAACRLEGVELPSWQTGTTCDCPMNCDFEKNHCGWEQLIQDSFDWTRHSGPTPSNLTGPNQDHTTGAGFYMYIEGNSVIHGDSARMISSVCHYNGPICLLFWYHMYGSAKAMALNIYMLKNNKATKLWSKTNSQGQEWHPGNLEIRAMGPFQIIVEGIRGSNAQSDVAIDDVSIHFGSCSGIVPGVVSGTALPSAAAEVPPSQPVCDVDCSFTGDLCSWNQMHTDAFDWTWHKGSTSTLMTGPSADHTGDGHYLYIEANSAAAGDMARLMSSECPASGPLCLRFWYHMYGSADAMGLNVYLLQGRKAEAVWRRRNDQGNMWHLALVNLTTTGAFQIIFEGIRGSSDLSDVAIDDISLHHGHCAAPLESVITERPQPPTTAPPESVFTESSQPPTTAPPETVITESSQPPTKAPLESVITERPQPPTTAPPESHKTEGPKPPTTSPPDSQNTDRTQPPTTSPPDSQNTDRTQPPTTAPPESVIPESSQPPTTAPPETVFTESSQPPTTAPPETVITESSQPPTKAPLESVITERPQPPTTAPPESHKTEGPQPPTTSPPDSQNTDRTQPPTTAPPESVIPESPQPPTTAPPETVFTESSQPPTKAPLESQNTERTQPPTTASPESHKTEGPQPPTTAPPETVITESLQPPTTTPHESQTTEGPQPPTTPPPETVITESSQPPTTNPPESHKTEGPQPPTTASPESQTTDRTQPPTSTPPESQLTERPQPTTAAEPQPTTATEPEPTTAAEPQPTTAAEQQPTTGAGLEPTAETGLQPTTEVEPQPTTAAGAQPTTAAGAQPTTAAGLQPTTAAGSQPTTAAGSQPSTAAGSETTTEAGSLAPTTAPPESVITESSQPPTTAPPETAFTESSQLPTTAPPETVITESLQPPTTTPHESQTTEGPQPPTTPPPETVITESSQPPTTNPPESHKTEGPQPPTTASPESQTTDRTQSPTSTPPESQLTERPQPTTTAEPQPTTATEPEPTTAAEPQPTTAAEQQPTTAAEQQPTTGAGLEPTAETGLKPTTEGEPQPTTAAGAQTTTTGAQPTTAAGAQPTTAAGSQPSTAAGSETTTEAGSLAPTTAPPESVITESSQPPTTAPPETVFTESSQPPTTAPPETVFTESSQPPTTAPPETVITESSQPPTKDPLESVITERPQPPTTAPPDSQNTDRTQPPTTAPPESVIPESSQPPTTAPPETVFTESSQPPTKAPLESVITERPQPPTTAPPETAFTESSQLPTTAPPETVITESLQPPTTTPHESQTTEGPQPPTTPPPETVITESSQPPTTNPPESHKTEGPQPPTTASPESQTTDRTQSPTSTPPESQLTERPQPTTTAEPQPTTATEPEPTTAAEPQPTTAAEQQPTTGAGLEPTAETGLQPTTEGEPQPTTAAGAQTTTTTGAQPTTVAGAQPTTAAGAQLTTTTAGQQPTTVAGPQTTTTAGQQPTTVAGPEPTTEDEPQPTTAAGPQPTTAAEPQPTTAAGSKPTTTNGPQPTTAGRTQPTTAGGTQPTTAAGPQPTTTAGPQPTTAAGSQPTTAAGSQPTTAAGAQLTTTTAGQQPTTVTGPQPTTTAGQQPTTVAGPEPTTEDEPQPTTAAGPQPTTAAEPQPTTAAGSKPTTMAGSQPTTAAGPQSTTAGGTQPTTAGGTQPTTAAGPQPTTTAGPQPTTAAGSQPTTAAGSQPTTVAGPEPTTAAGSQPTAASGPQPTTAGGPKPTTAGGPKPTTAGGPKTTTAAGAQLTTTIAGSQPTTAAGPQPTTMAGSQPTTAAGPQPTTTTAAGPQPSASGGPKPTTTARPKPPSTPVPTPSCPENSHYTSCIPACSPTCTHLNGPTRCNDSASCVSGCVCDDGFVQKLQHCVPIQECGCVDMNGNKHQFNEVWYTNHCSEKCECEEDDGVGEIDCDDNECDENAVCLQNDKGEYYCQPTGFSECTIKEDPEYRTFDKLKHDFEGEHSYVLVQTKRLPNNLPEVYIECINRRTAEDEDDRHHGDSSSEEHQRHRDKDEDDNDEEDDDKHDDSEESEEHYRLQELKIRVYNHTVEFKRNLKLVVDGRRTHTPVSPTAGLNIRQHSSRIYLKTDFGLSVEFDGHSKAEIILPRIYKRKVQGLCGNFDSQKWNDWMKPDGTIAGSVQEFGESWRV